MTILSETGSVTAAPIYVLLKDILAIAFAPLNSAPPPHWGWEDGLNIRAVAREDSCFGCL